MRAFQCDELDQIVALADRLTTWLLAQPEAQANGGHSLITSALLSVALKGFASAMSLSIDQQARLSVAITQCLLEAMPAHERATAHATVFGVATPTGGAH